MLTFILFFFGTIVVCLLASLAGWPFDDDKEERIKDLEDKLADKDREHKYRDHD